MRLLVIGYCGLTRWTIHSAARKVLCLVNVPDLHWQDAIDKESSYIISSKEAKNDFRRRDLISQILTRDLGSKWVCDLWEEYRDLRDSRVNSRMDNWVRDAEAASKSEYIVVGGTPHIKFALRDRQMADLLTDVPEELTARDLADLGFRGDEVRAVDFEMKESAFMTRRSGLYKVSEHVQDLGMIVLGVAELDPKLGLMNVSYFPVRDRDREDSYFGLGCYFHHALGTGRCFNTAFDQKFKQRARDLTGGDAWLGQWDDIPEWKIISMMLDLCSDPVLPPPRRGRFGDVEVLRWT